MALRFGNTPRLSRRNMLQLAALGAGAVLVPGGTSRSDVKTAPHRFLQINLEGGWDSAFSIDPIVGTKRKSKAYEKVYLSSELDPRAVPGKSSLMVGPGLIPCTRAFSRIPTAFVNGIFMEVSGHDFAQQYMSSGILSLSNSRDYPAIPALLGAAAATFPPHIVIGLAAPLGDTRFTSPPLQAYSSEGLNTMVSGPSILAVPPGVLQDHYSAKLVADAHKLIDGMDKLVLKGLPETYQQDLANWRSASGRVDEIYARKLAGRLALDAETSRRYGFEPETFGTKPGHFLAGVFLLMKSNLCPYLTVSIGSFDTHFDHMATHLPLMQEFARAFDTFVDDLLMTEDPAAPGQTLADTTTIYLTSEFVRTPSFSDTFGTEHWPSASAVLMGRGIVDGAVIGATGDDAEALGWDGTRTVKASEETHLLPDHLVATILANIGGNEMADTVSDKRLRGLFHTTSKGG